MESNKKIIFLIEDDAAIVDVYKIAFDAANINFEIMTLGKQAIEKIKEVQCGKTKKPCLVLLDLILPDMNGTEILKEIKKNEKTKDIAVFLLSNYAAEDIPQLDGIKPDKFILKASITPTELIELIKSEFKKG
jgi:DNA-binding response OmpR family regulator